MLSHKRFFSGFFGELIFFSRAELFRICDGFAHSVAFLTSKCFTPFGLEREMPFETVVVQHTPILILPTSQHNYGQGSVFHKNSVHSPNLIRAA